MSIAVISGAPGTGKSTTARALAAGQQNGVYLETDLFFHALPNLIDPSKPAAKSQNEAITRAWCVAAKSWHDDGYSVFVDGVIGPWLFPLILPILQEFEYHLLQASLATLQARVKARDGQASARPSVVARMYPQFEALDERYDTYRINTENKSSDEVIVEVVKRRGKQLVPFNALTNVSNDQ